MRLRLAFFAAALVATACQCNPPPPPMDKLHTEGEPCTDDSECDTGFCESVLGGGKKCLRNCTTGCKALEQCEPLAPDGGDDRFGCVPAFVGLCKTCDDDSACPYPGDHCIVLGNEHFCGQNCAYDMTCPSSYTCTQSTLLDGGVAQSQCQPASGTCACTDKSAGQTAPCQQMNALGRCVGVKVCQPPGGYGPCTAHVPTAEICNGQDDDCNGLVDDGLPDLHCGAGECARSSASCANGVAQSCVPGTPTAERCDGKDNDCDGVIDNGFNLMTDVGNCGSCGNACVVNNAVPACIMGMCGVLHCLPGYTDRDGVAANGCEYPCTPTDGGIEICDGIDNDCNGIIDDGFNLTSDPHNCGQCNLTCSIANGTVATYQCVARVCGILTCESGLADCNQLYVDGCETDTRTDLSNCGGCGKTCAPAHATAACTAGMCGITACASGWSNCNMLLADGCEVNTGGDVANCGACGHVCNYANATASCTTGQCGFTCQPNWWNADNDSSNGCEYACVRTNNGVEVCDHVDNNCDGRIDEGFNLSSDLSNCGGCGNVCSAAFAQSLSCAAGSCGITACLPGHADCDGLYATGCETDTNTNLMACGACGRVCAPPNANATCSAGTCGISSCQGPYRDCNMQVSDGCEVNPQTDLHNCGSCGNTCALPFATPTCGAGQCKVLACNPGHYNLDGVDANGCEYACTPTGLEVCDYADNDCNGVIDDGFNLNSDTQNCGTCGHVCSAVNTASYSCSGGSCGVLTCQSGFADCDGVFANGCEVNEQGDVNHCGSCGHACSLPNATPGCSTGQCVVLSCNSGFADCDNAPANGCEIDKQDDSLNCGACGHVCSRPNTVPSCGSGTCSFVCQAGFWDLDGDPSNGCEYACTYQSATDLPDLGFVDANCDGIDGEVNNAIFVSPGGSDTNPGTRALPKLTITGGLNGAVTLGKRDVYVAADTYVESVSLVANKGVYGAYAPGTWARSAVNVVSVMGANPVLVINNASSSTVQYVGFFGANTSTAGASAYGGFVVNSTNVSLEKVDLHAGSAGAGVSGTNGASGTAGTNGVQGVKGCENSSIFCSSCSTPLGGAGGTSACGRSGGNGGNAGYAGGSGAAGATGVAGTPGGPGTPAGQGNWSTPSTYWGGTGANGADGANGTSGAAFGTLNAAGYVVALTSSGVSGAHGNGGGGGGGGGGGTNNCDSFGGSGAGGGAGGCLGTAGTAGTSGGSSIALFLWSSSATGTQCSFVTSTGGHGGNGGTGQAGGAGGLGGAINPYGGSGDQDDGSNGGKGGNGGRGGNGGHGGAGGGGPVIGVARGGGSTWSDGNTSTFTLGAPGGGGVSSGGNGAGGLQTNVY